MQLKERYFVLLLLIVVFGVYYPSLFIPFNSVDDTRMVNNLLNADGISVWQPFYFGGSGNYYRPLLASTFIIDKYAWGLHESFMHLENIILHAMNVILVFYIARRIALAEKVTLINPLAFCAALLFALHPINTEAVNWISGRTDLLAGLFVLCSLLFLLRALSSAENFISCFMAAVTFFIGMFAKETAIFFLPAAILIIMMHDKVNYLRISAMLKHCRHRLSFYILYLSAAGSYLLIRSLALAQGDGGISLVVKGVVSGDSSISGESRIIALSRAVLKASGFYAKKLFNPFPLNFGIVNVPDYYAIAGFIVIAIICYLIWKRELVSVLFVSAFLVGSSSFLVAVSRLAWTPIAERYMYIPCSLFSMAIIFRLYSWFSKRDFQKAFVVALCLLFSGSAYATMKRNYLWQDNLTLFEDTVRKSPEFQTVKNDLAAALMEKGRKAEAFAVISSIKLSAAYGAYDELGVINKAMALKSNGKLLAARNFLKERYNENSKRYIELTKQLISINGACLDDKKYLDIWDELYLENIELTKKLQIRTHDPFYLYRIGQMYLKINDSKEAASYFRRAYSESPADAYYKQAALKLAEKLAQ
jgi:tetratricopeptide (TPR) repeat protein